MHILFSCTFAPAAESYTVHLRFEEQNEIIIVESLGCYILHNDHYMILNERCQDYFLCCQRKGIFNPTNFTHSFLFFVKKIPIISQKKLCFML
ncbi:hypothetical protein EW027_15160 [Aeribacillus pallidus]|nr:hypothetical protein EW027_15160 [Aeribacillus pallidus]